MSNDLFRGERGPKGDHGQKGEPGTPAKSPWYVLTDRRLLAIFLMFVLAAALVIQGITSTQDDLSNAQAKINDNTHSIQVLNYNRCLDGVKILVRFNEGQKTLRDIVVSRTDLTPVLKRKYIAAYNRQIIKPIPNCDALKPPPLEKKQ